MVLLGECPPAPSLHRSSATCVPRRSLVVLLTLAEFLVMVLRQETGGLREAAYAALTQP